MTTTSFERPRREKTRQRFVAAALLLAFLAGCQASRGAMFREHEEAEEDRLDSVAQKRFRDAVRSYEEAQHLAVIDWDALYAKFQAVVEREPRFAEAHHNLGRIAEMRGLLEEAAKHYRDALEQEPGLAQARENLGLVLERLGDERGAEREYKELLRLRPDHAGARARLAALHLRTGNPHRARELAREALLRDPENLAALMVLVEVHLALGEPEIARLVALRVDRSLEGPEGPYMLGVVFEHLGERGAAVLHYRRAAGRDPRHVASRARLGRLALELRNYDEAIEAFERLVQLDPNSFESWLNLGIARLGKSQIPEAKEALERAQAMRPDDTRPSYPLAVILHRHENEPERALVHYRRYVSNAPIHLPPEHPVFAQLRECEQLVQFIAQARAEEEAARRREAMLQGQEEGEAVPAKVVEESDPDLLPPPDLDPDEPAPVEGF